MEHQAPWKCTLAKEDKSKCKPGGMPRSDQEFFEVLCLCVLQAGLGWRMIRENWVKFRQVFYGFDFDRLAEAKPTELLNAPGSIKNRKKVEAIIYNAEEFQRIRQEYGSFSNFLDSLKTMRHDETFKVLTKRFRHIGDYTAEYFLHSVGYWK